MPPETKAAMMEERKRSFDMRSPEDALSARSKQSIASLRYHENMSPEAKAIRSKKISESVKKTLSPEIRLRQRNAALQQHENMSPEAKAIRSKKISESVKKTLSKKRNPKVP
jgi:hypothetical protein